MKSQETTDQDSEKIQWFSFSESNRFDRDIKYNNTCIIIQLNGIILIHNLKQYRTNNTTSRPTITGTESDFLKILTQSFGPYYPYMKAKIILLYESTIPAIDGNIIALHSAVANLELGTSKFLLVNYMAILAMFTRLL